MSRMAKGILAGLLALLLCGAALAVEPDPDALFEGKWEDVNSQRAWMRIDHNWDDNYDVRIFWGSGIYEGDEWYMTGVFNPEEVSLVYTNGSHYTCTYDDDGNLTDIQTHYEDARGEIYFDEADFLRFDTGDASLASCQFAWSEE